MATTQDLDLGIHKGRKRVLLLNSNDIGIAGVNIGVGIGVTSRNLYAPGFTHFAGQMVATTPVSTTLEVSVFPRIGGVANQTSPRYVTSMIVTIANAAARRYAFYWGKARGLIPDSAGNGSTFVFSAFFAIIVVNRGANIANSVTIEGLEYS